MIAVIPTHDRPASLRLVLDAMDAQDYLGSLEVVVVDDSTRPLERRGVNVVRVKRGVPLGTKMNIGTSRSDADIAMKVDDDDWYGPSFVTTMVETILGGADVAVVQPFRIMDVQSWALFQADEHRCAGSGLTYRRALWRSVPFRPRRAQVDGWFLQDALSAHASVTSCDAGADYLYIRNAHDNHLWTYLPDGRTFGSYMTQLEDLGDVSKAVPQQVLDRLAHIKLHGQS